MTLRGDGLVDCRLVSDEGSDGDDDSDDDYDDDDDALRGKRRP